MKTNYINNSVSSTQQPFKSVSPIANNNSSIQSDVIKDTVTISPEYLILSSINIKQILTSEQSKALFNQLDNAFDNPPKYEISKDLLPSLPQEDNITYVQQYGYSTNKAPEVLRTGPISACTVITLFNQDTKNGAMFHLARENIDHFLISLNRVSALGTSAKFKDADIFQRVISHISKDTVSNLEVNIIGSNQEALSLWGRCVNLLGCKNTKTHFYPGWRDTPPKGTGDSLLKDIKNRSLSKGFVQFSCKDGSISVSQNPEQFIGGNKIPFTGYMSNCAIPLIKNSLISKYYENNYAAVSLPSWPETTIEDFIKTFDIKIISNE